MAAATSWESALPCRRRPVIGRTRLSICAGRRLFVAGIVNEVVIADAAAAALLSSVPPPGDLDELIGLLAAEVTHEPTRRRQRRFDVAFEALNTAAEFLDSR